MVDKCGTMIKIHLQLYQKNDLIQIVFIFSPRILTNVYKSGPSNNLIQFQNEFLLVRPVDSHASGYGYKIRKRNRSN